MRSGQHRASLHHLMVQPISWENKELFEESTDAIIRHWWQAHPGDLLRCPAQPLPTRHWRWARGGDVTELDARFGSSFAKTRKLTPHFRGRATNHFNTGALPRFCLRCAAMRSGSLPRKSHQRRFLSLNSVKPWLIHKEMSRWHHQCDRRNYFSIHGADPFFSGSRGEIHICFPLLSLCASAGGLPTMSWWVLFRGPLLWLVGVNTGWACPFGILWPALPCHTSEWESRHEWMDQSQELNWAQRAVFRALRDTGRVFKRWPQGEAFLLLDHSLIERACCELRRGHRSQHF